MSAEHFMQRHWQKRPLLVRAAVAPGYSPVDRRGLFALAARDDVESRLITRSAVAKAQWQLRQGPFTRTRLPGLKQPLWTLLVQGVDLHIDAAHELLSQFRFIPAARLDDLMVSYASDGGGVGPHVDSYDVFLLQVAGCRRWQIGRVKDATLRDDVPLKILRHFEPDHEWQLAPGDMLYLPPQWAHDGVAVGDDCMTCSIGFRAPSAGELAREVLLRLTEAVEEGDDSSMKRYRDPTQSASAHPGLLPSALNGYAEQAIRDLLARPGALDRALGEFASEPKASVVFDPGQSHSLRNGVRLDRRSRMLYDRRHVYINGESYRAAGVDARVMRRLADRLEIDAQHVLLLSPPARALLDSWVEAGWVRSITVNDRQ